MAGNRVELPRRVELLVLLERRKLSARLIGVVYPENDQQLQRFIRELEKPGCRVSITLDSHAARSTVPPP